MKKIIILLIVIGAVVFYMTKGGSEGEPADKNTSIQSYITQNISNLSPEKETLGGKFYITEIEAMDGKGIVWYEDGHNAFRADFTYKSSKKGYEITSFTIR